MYLKSIELYGFKSFAERAEIIFQEGIAGIVGPNGSGKSNITDAVRWVLGEQSAKILRGSKMEDLIFNGTDRRKQLGMAEVSLTFDNSEGKLPIEFREVTVKRRVYRSGESEYLINNNAVKLRDIKELFMDTGIGIDGYSIIGQGRIDSILSSKSEDRRKIFEEAAGIVKYKIRKEKTEKKLEKTNQNILRVEDILKELEIRINPLRNEAEKAKAYDVFYTELKNLEISLFMEEIDRINEKLIENRAKTEALEKHIESYNGRKKDCKAALLENEKILETLRRTGEEGDKKLAATQESRNQINYEIDLAGERKRTADKEKALKESQMGASFEAAEKLKMTLDEERKELEGFLLKEAVLKDELHDSEMEAAGLNEKMAILLERKRQEKAQIFRALNESADMRSEMASLKSSEVAMAKRMEKLKSEELNIKSFLQVKQSEISEMESCMKKEGRAAELSATSLRASKMILDERMNAEAEIKKSIELNERHLRTLEERHQFYKKLVDNYEGFNSSVKNTFKALQKSPLSKNVEGTVAEIIKVDKRYETAIETALGYSSQNIICDTVDSASAIISLAKREKTGRITLLPMDEVKGRRQTDRLLPKDDGLIGKARDLVSYDSRFDNIVDFLLGGILVVEDADAAVRMIRSGTRGYRIITLDGDVFNPGGAITGGSLKGQNAGLLSRQRILEETEQAILGKSMEMKTLQGEWGKILDSRGKAEKDFKLAEIENLRLKQSVEALSRKIEVANSNLEAILEKKSANHEEARELEAEMKKTSDARLCLAEKIRLFETDNTSVEESMDVLETEEKMLVENLEELNKTINDKKLERAVLFEKTNTSRMEIARKEESIESYGRFEAESKTQLDLLQKQIEAFEKEIIQKQAQSEQLTGEIKEIMRENDAVRAAAANNGVLMRQIQIDIENLDDNIQMEKDRLHKLELMDARLQMNYDGFIKQLWEFYQLSYIEAMDASMKVENRNAMIKRIEALKKELEFLGDVNKSAIKEFEEVTHRYEFLGKQKTDLLEAKETLEDLIVRLEEKMVRIFKDEIKIINQNFNYTFGKLFNGGKAEIIFEEMDDLLNSHIDIYAEPPGKKLQNLNLLSGGEKALTAIAMLFAILMKKPSPFCVLDEIEAALDDVNVYKFAAFLKEFSDQSQFILITHRKGTMEIADFLYGITMEEKGISKIISLEMKNKAS